MAGTEIRSITARQVYTNRGNPGVEAVVTTENGATGRAMCTSGISIGTHEIHFDFDGGERFRGGLAVIRRIPRFASAHLPGSETENGHGKSAIEFLFRAHFGNPTDWMKKTSDPSGRFSLEMKPLSKLPRITVESPAEAQ